jgi:hypothetical protein
MDNLNNEGTTLTTLVSTDLTDEAILTDNRVIEAVAAATAAATRSERAVWQEDVSLMNDIINEAAERADLCSAYESALDDVNARCTRIELQGRSRSYTAAINLTVSFEARGNDEAYDRAASIAQAIYNSGDNLYGETYTVDAADHDDVEPN